MSEKTTTIHVVCLCAAWCRLCEDYAAVLGRVMSELALREAVFCEHWLDIEDEAELIGDVDVETFPTLLVIGPEGVRFAGPVAPHADTLRRLLLATATPTAAGGPLSPVGPEFQAFAARFRDRIKAEPLTPC